MIKINIELKGHGIFSKLNFEGVAFVVVLTKYQQHGMFIIVKFDSTTLVLQKVQEIATAEQHIDIAEKTFNFIDTIMEKLNTSRRQMQAVTSTISVVSPTDCKVAGDMFITLLDLSKTISDSNINVVYAHIKALEKFQFPPK